MKKLSYVCLLLVTLFSGFLLTNIFDTKDRIRLNEIEMQDSSFQFYVKESQKSIQEQLTFFENLAKTEHVNIFKTDVRNNIIIKSVVFKKSSFPFENFNLPNKDLFRNPSEIYTNYNSTENNVSDTKIPTFSKSKIILQTMENYYKDSSNSLNGIYSVVGTDDLNTEKIKDQLSSFFSISQEELFSKPLGSATGFVNSSFMIFVAIIISTFLILAIVNIYAPLLDLKKIGVSKLNGISNKSIFFDFIKMPLLVTITISLVLDVFFFFYYDYHPHQFFLMLILSQILIIFLFLITNIFTYLMIRNVTISKMLKNFLNFKFGVIICYFVKGIVTFLVTVLLIMASSEISTLLDQYKLNDSWEKNGNVITLETYYLVNDEFQNFLLNNGAVENRFATLYSELEDQVGAKYIYSSVITPKKILTDRNPDIYAEDETYEVMYVSDNYIESLDLSVENFDQSLKENGSRVFFVPNSYKDNKNISSLCQDILFDNISSDQQENSSMQDFPIKIYYYDDSNFEVFSYANELANPIFKQPIFMTLNAADIPFFEKILLTNTGITNPLKIENTQNTREILNTIIAKNSYKDLNLKFSSINSILGDTTSAYTQSVQIFIILLVSIFLLSVFTSIFLVNCIVLSDRKKLAVYKLFGFSLFNRYYTLFIIFGGMYIVQLLAVSLFSKTILLIPYILITLLIDSMVIVQVILRKEKNSLANVLKGE